MSLAMPEQGSTTPRPPGLVIWITGLAGAGKTSVARGVRDRLRDLGQNPIFVDGDSLRAILGATQGYEPADRLNLAGRYSRMCHELALQGFDVICATISMFHEVRAWNRANLPRYLEVYLRVPPAELMRRNQKGLYTKAADAPPGPVAGVDHAVEEPLTPDLIVDNFGGTTAQAAVDAIVATAKRNEHSR